MKRIQHSDVYRARFQKNIKLQRYSRECAANMKKLSSANHRFDRRWAEFKKRGDRG